MGDYIQPLGFSRTLMLQQLALFAESVGLFRMAWKLYNLIDSIEEDCLNPILVSMRAMNNAHLAAWFSTPLIATQWGIRSVNSLIVASGMRQLGVDVYDQQTTVEECLDQVDLYTRKLVERELIYIVLLPILVNMMGDDIPLQQVGKGLEEFEQAFNDNEASLYDLDHWKEMLAFFKQLVPIWEGQNNFEETKELVIPENHPFLKIFWMLLGSKSKGLSPRERVVLQFQAVNYLSIHPDKSRYIWTGVGKFLHKYWFEFPGFSLRNPNALKNDLKLISAELGEKTSARVILRVLPAVDATFSQEDFTRFQEMAQTGLY